MLVHWLLLAALPPALADASPRLFHRVVDPASPDAPFRPRAVLSVSASGPAARASLAPTQSLEADLSQFAATLHHTPGALYQVALEREGADPSTWDISSVKACYLPHSTSEEITVHVDSDGTPFTLDYFVGPIPHDGSCPKLKRGRGKGSTLVTAGEGSPESESAPELLHTQHTAVFVKSPTLPPLPSLRVPPPLTPEGTPAVPPPEKSFLQKYWMYIAVAAVALLIAPAGEEEKEGGGGGGGGGRR
ncbi:uncharacterized protein C8Q71DRAFT_719541 [Rhodofomes roseus]|uniref:ER membrane protein complex subunit 10 n=1 Tax=Rhodofomes roseus TaxID=34475 RepID=A0ABQ8KXB7_9APHY|nr:uncharacterized protein C8Q71DRAFT_719541 [Rhodofomes roseus]KAH9843856.1 hypothetical protein C8Q71DRAFT_719541 [Rhodofomes roseus]